MILSSTNLVTGIPSSKVKFSRLSSTDDDYIDLEFKKNIHGVTYEAIALAIVLFLIDVFLIIGCLLLAGYLKKGWWVAGADQGPSVLITGILVFLPELYHLHISYYASKGYWGYSYQ
ncbi:unnamed protein product [Nyctereutes procyonoides]|uniref:Transmembrane protein 230 n=1 Tax=Nyctereutes procyonoides TaxID=34880 RepID=A0A811Z8U6_NYCPR|nr:transmembrane protein 230-like [Nyctereutes procyonoides]CAD7684964.1 unnamed protein product [Nyctereutes procyonoides]